MEKSQSGAKHYGIVRLLKWFSIAMIVGPIVLAVLSKSVVKEILNAVGNDIFGRHGSSAEATTAFVVILILFLITIGVCQFLYQRYIGRFAEAMSDSSDYAQLKRAQRGADMQLAALILLVLMPFVLNTIGDTKPSDAVLVLLVLLPWVMAIAGTVVMRIAFKNLLYNSDDWNRDELEGFDELHHTATCQLRLLFMPLVYLVFVFVMYGLIIDSLKGIWDGGGYVIFSMGDLIDALDDMGERGNSSLSTLRTYYYIYIAGTAIFLFFSLLWYLYALAKPIIAWNRFAKNVETKDDAEAEGEDKAEGDAVANWLEKLLPLHYRLLSAAIVVLTLMPMVSCSHSSDDDDDIRGRYYDDYDDDDTDSRTGVAELSRIAREQAQSRATTAKVWGYYTEDDGEGGVNIGAQMGDKSVDTNIEVEGLCYIVDQHDYDGDGNVDALISWSVGVAYPGNTFIVYYDANADKFRRTADFEPNCKAEANNGEWTILYTSNLEMKRYRLADGRLITIEHKTLESGSKLREFTYEDIFGSDHEIDSTKDLAIDLNDDGIDEVITFTLSYYRWGPIMYAESVRSGGKAYDMNGQGTFVVLKKKTNGWHDIQWDNDDLDEHILLRWTGNGYKEATL